MEIMFYFSIHKCRVHSFSCFVHKHGADYIISQGKIGGLTEYHNTNIAPLVRKLQ
jgi:hypothetical protein